MKPDERPRPLSMPTTAPATAKSMSETVRGPEGPERRTRHTTVFVILDAGRSDYVDAETMPFVHGLAQRGIRGRLESPPGPAERTVLFSGTYPEVQSDFSAFVFDPEAGIPAWARRWRPVRRLARLQRLFHPAFHSLRRGDRRSPEGTVPSSIVAPDAPGALGVSSIFDICRDHSLSYRYITQPPGGSDDDVHDALVRELRTGTDCDLFVAQFRSPEILGTLHGPFSEPMREVHLRELDAKVASIHAALNAAYASWDLFVCSDHGLAPVHGKIDVFAALKDLKARPGEDYVAFVHSTLVVFWALTEKGRKGLPAALSRIPGAHIVGDEERRRMRIPAARRYGDHILAAEPGFVFHPDFSRASDADILGMHGYLDRSAESPGIAILTSNNGHTPPREFGTRPVVDVFPTLCDLIGVPPPKDRQGKSLLVEG